MTVVCTFSMTASNKLNATENAKAKEDFLNNIKEAFVNGEIAQVSGFELNTDFNQF